MDTLATLSVGAVTGLIPDDAAGGYANLIIVYDNGTNADYSDQYETNVAGLATLYSYDINWNLLTTVIVGLNETMAGVLQQVQLNTSIIANEVMKVIMKDFLTESVHQF